MCAAGADGDCLDTFILSYRGCQDGCQNATVDLLQLGRPVRTAAAGRRRLNQFAASPELIGGYRVNCQAQTKCCKKPFVDAAKTLGKCRLSVM